MRRTISGLAIVALTAALAACGGGGGAGKGPTEIQLQEQSASGESGTATLTREGDKTKVVLGLQSGTSTAQPAHIHSGTCSSLDPTPAYPLNNVVNGKSTTVVNVPLDTLEKTAYAINVHKSTQDLKTYVACGNISENSAPAKTDTSSGY
jgi:predicted small lipoprotein YifL